MSDTLDAASYDAWFDTRWGRYAFEVERAALLDAIGPLQGRRVADVACGTGRFTAALEEAGAHTVGIDLDPGMLEIARERVVGQLLAADAHRLPLADDDVDVAVAVTLLEFVEDPVQVLRELGRVTRPGGRVVVAGLNPHSPWGLVHHRELAGPPWSEAQLRTRDQLGDLIDRAGLGRVGWHAALYAPGEMPGLHRLGRLLEPLGRSLLPTAGAFQVAVIDLER